jgi:predicted dehydrogenase
MNAKTNRRQFLKTTAAAGICYWIAERRLRAEGRSPNEKLNVACIGVGGQGAASVRACARENIVAVCDVDDNRIANTKAKRYKDWRKLFDEMAKQIDAVTVATPDHMHGSISLAALKLGKHLYVEKPLAHNVRECRLVADMARKMKVVTQLGNQGHSMWHSRRCVELLQAGVIGKVTEVHTAHKGAVKFPATKPGLMKESGRPADTPPVPPGLDWDLWLGVAPERPYHPAYHPFKWRDWRDFGCGGYGDWACHLLAVAVSGLRLQYPIRVEASGPPVPYERNPDGAFRFTFPARGDDPPVTVTWHGKGSGVPADWLEGDAKGTLLLVGDKGMMLCNHPHFGGVDPVLLPKEKFAGVKPPESKIPKDARSHHADRLWCIKNGGQPVSNLPDFGGYMGEIARLGHVAFYAGGSIEWDGQAMKVTDTPEANQYVGREYRKGWEI